jgi:hypothetical protein
MKVLVCGGRGFTDRLRLYAVLDDLEPKPILVIQGGARGADIIAKHWAILNNVHYVTVPALWERFGRQAGPLRNSAMLELEPDICVAAPGGSGTADMVKKCRAAKIDIIEVDS